MSARDGCLWEMSLVSARPPSGPSPRHGGISCSPTKPLAPSRSDGKSIPGSTQRLPRPVPHPSMAASHHSSWSISIAPGPAVTHRGGPARAPMPPAGRQGQHGTAPCPLPTHRALRLAAPPVARIWPAVLEWWIKSLARSLTHRAALARKHVLHLILRVFLRLKA